MEHAGPAMSYGQPVADMEDDLSTAVGTDLRALVRNVSTDHTVSIVVKFLAVGVYAATKGMRRRMMLFCRVLVWSMVCLRNRV